MKAQNGLAVGTVVTTMEWPGSSAHVTSVPSSCQHTLWGGSRRWLEYSGPYQLHGRPKRQSSWPVASPWPRSPATAGIWGKEPIGKRYPFLLAFPIRIHFWKSLYINAKASEIHACNVLSMNFMKTPGTFLVLPGLTRGGLSGTTTL